MDELLEKMAELLADLKLGREVSDDQLGAVTELLDPIVRERGEAKMKESRARMNRLNVLLPAAQSFGQEGPPHQRLLLKRAAAMAAFVEDGTVPNEVDRPFPD